MLFNEELYLLKKNGIKSLEEAKAFVSKIKDEEGIFNNLKAALEEMTEADFLKQIQKELDIDE